MKNRINRCGCGFNEDVVKHGIVLHIARSGFLEGVKREDY